MKMTKKHTPATCLNPFFALTLISCACLLWPAQSTNAAVKHGNPKKTRMLYVPLVPKPTDPAYSGSTPVNPAKLFIDVVDARENKDEIGQNTEEDNKPPVKVLVDEGDTPVQFVQKLVTKQCQDLALPVAPTPAAAERIVSLKLNRFWAEESPSYVGSVRMAAEVKDADGKVLWRGSAAGDNKKFGRSLSTENYRECLTDSTQGAINQLFGEPGFQAAIAKK